MRVLVSEELDDAYRAIYDVTIPDWITIYVRSIVAMDVL